MKDEKIVVKNAPAYAADCDFVVVRNIDGEYWFYGGYNECAEANRVACLVDGLALTRKSWRNS